MSREPPTIEREVSVALSQEEAYARFVRKMSDWWPLEHFSILGPACLSCSVEEKRGGDIYEVGPDGEIVLWGTVTDLDPPRRIECSWHPGRPPQTAQKLVVTFRPARSGSGTVVRLEHSDWGKLGEGALEVHSLYDQGWDTVFVEGYGSGGSTA